MPLEKWKLCAECIKGACKFSIEKLCIKILVQISILR